MTGVQTCALPICRENRRSDKFVTDTLGKEWSGKAGTAAANFALEKHFINQQSQSGTQTPVAPAQQQTKTTSEPSKQNQSAPEVKPFGSGGSSGSMVNAGSGGITPAPTAPLEAGDKTRGGAAALAQNKPAENKPDISTPGGGAVVPESGPSQKKKKVSESTLVQAYLQRFGKKIGRAHV